MNLNHFHFLDKSQCLRGLQFELILEDDHIILVQIPLPSYKGRFKFISRLLNLLRKNYKLEVKRMRDQFSIFFWSLTIIYNFPDQVGIFQNPN